MRGFLNDLRLAARSLFRTPAFAAAAIIALGLGTGAAAGVFSLLEGIVLRPLPFEKPGQLVSLWETNAQKNVDHEPLSPVNFMDYHGLTSAFADAAAWWTPQLNLVDAETGEPIRVSAVETTENLFRVLGVSPSVGHNFTIDSTLFGAEREVIISHRLWVSRFRNDQKAIGKTIQLNGFPYTIAGVMPPGFGFPGETDVWQHLSWDLHFHSRGAHFMGSLARLKPGISIERANVELAALTTRLGGDFPPTNKGWSARAVDLSREITGVYRPALIALIGAAVLLLAIACLNVANLLLARATARQREVAVRIAIGASRARLLRLFLAEGFVLAVCGAAMGLLVAVASVKGLIAWSPVDIPRAGEVSVNLSVLLFATAVTAITAVAFGIAPALLVSHTGVQETLKDGTRGSAPRGRILRRTLVVAEVAFAVALLSGAGVLIRSVSSLLDEDTGVASRDNLITANIQLPDAAYRDWPRVDQFYSQLMQGLRSHHEIQVAGASHFLPLEAGWSQPVAVVGEAPASPDNVPMAQLHAVDDGYFAALGATTVQGRAFTSDDDASHAGVIIINEALAKQLFPQGDAIGKRIAYRGRNIGPLGTRLVQGDEHEVIGVVRNIKNLSLKSAAAPAMFFSNRQFPFREMNIVLRGSATETQLTSLIRDEVRRLDSGLPIAKIATMDRVLAASVDPPKFVMIVMALFAGLALTLAAVGIYGLLTYAVASRRKEFGIRLALGSAPGAVMRLIMWEGMSLAIVGSFVGAAIAFVSARPLTALLYKVGPWDAWTTGGVMLVVTAVALAACVVPGRRAASENPANALRG